MKQAQFKILKLIIYFLEADSLNKFSVEVLYFQSLKFQDSIFKQQNIIQLSTLAMRNSPINHLRHGRDYEHSPYQSGVHRSGQRERQYSPERASNVNDAEYWRHRAKNLESSVLGMTQQLRFQQRKLLKIQELEQKIEVLLAQNSHLVDENENLIRLVQQKKSQADSWRSRFEGQYSNANLAEAQKKKIFDHLNIKDQEHQIQIDKLLSEITRLQDQKIEMENLKHIEITALKNRLENEAVSQIQNLKRSQYGNNELLQLNIRKLKDQIQQKDFQIENIKRDNKIENERFTNEINFLKNQIKKLQQQREHEVDLLKAQADNQRNNILRQHRKNQEELKNLHEAKVKRLSYELDEKKNEIEECYGKLRKGGKQNEADLNQMVNQKSKLRQEIKDDSNDNRQRITQLTQFYENQISQIRENNVSRENNLIQLYDGQIASLNEIIEAKEEEIQRLLDLNASIKANEQQRLDDIKRNNNNLKKKIEDLVMHYEREVQLMKIKISQLYQADIDSLRNNLQNRLATHQRERDILRELLQNTRDRLAEEVQANLDLRKEYENRLNQFKIKYEREHQQLQDLIALTEKQHQNQTSKMSLTFIEHTDKMQQTNLNKKELMNQIRELERQIQNKNKEIEALNLKYKKTEGLLNHQIKKLEDETNRLKDQHQAWLDRQDRETQQWNRQRSQLKEQNHKLNLRLKQTQRKSSENQDDLTRKLEERRIEIARMKGTIEQMENLVAQWQGKHRVQVSNVQKTQVQTQALMNNEKTKLTEARNKEQSLRDDQFKRVVKKLEGQIEGLKKENDILRDNNEKSKIRQAELGVEISNLLDTVNKRNTLEQHVINIGLSNNYFKNVAQIFKRQIQ